MTGSGCHMTLTMTGRFASDFPYMTAMTAIFRNIEIYITTETAASYIGIWPSVYRICIANSKSARQTCHRRQRTDIAGETPVIEGVMEGVMTGINSPI